MRNPHKVTIDSNDNEFFQAQCTDCNWSSDTFIDYQSADGAAGNHEAYSLEDD